MREMAFDDFYRSTRTRLLHQTFLLTGDLTAAVKGTREAYVVAWHHWGKVGALADPLTWVRPLAWRMAQRRHTGRVWHRHVSLTEHQQAVLDGLQSLTASQRRLVLLVHEAGLPLPEAARELALTSTAADERLRAAEARLAASWSSLPLEATPGDVAARLAVLAPASVASALPRTPLVLRAGRRRRRLQTATIVVGVLAATLVSGAVAHQVPLPSGPAGGTNAPDEPTLADTLLTAADLAVLTRPRDPVIWAVRDTSDNTSGRGVAAPCRPQRFADPEGAASLVRVFAAQGRPVGAVQTTEISADVPTGRRTFDTLTGWFADCLDERAHLLATYRLSGLGDEAIAFALLNPSAKAPWQLVAVGRHGEAVTSLMVRARAQDAIRPERLLRAFGTAMRMLCADTSCVSSPRLTERRPLPTDGPPGMLDDVDLPPIRSQPFPWVGTDPAPATRQNPARTVCDRASFSEARTARTRTFVMPQAKVPVRFGLTETYGRFADPAAASRFFDRVAGRVAGCPDRDLTTTVTTTARGRARDGIRFRAWTLRTEVDDNASVRFRVGLVQFGRQVAQVTFVPTAGDDVSDAQMRSLLVRAGERLSLL